MPEYLLSNGIRLTTSAGVNFVETRSAAGSPVSRRRGADGDSGAVTAGEVGLIEKAVSDPDIACIGHISLEPPPVAMSRRRALGSPEASVTVDVQGDESAVLLVEKEGSYEWRFESASRDSAGGKRRRVARARQVQFSLSFASTPARGDRRGPVLRVIAKPLRVLIFKVVARVTLPVMVRAMEARRVSQGWIHVQGLDSTKWTSLPDLSGLPLPKNERAKILFLVHGTFSSTIGGFGGLTTTPWGREFLTKAYAEYHAVVGFDHPTLSVDPARNAQDIYDGLKAEKWAQPPIIHAVSHSRGGIVLRSLIETLLARGPAPVQVNKAVFVGAVNGGTLLAESENWSNLIDIYTNAGVGACRVAAAFPHAAPVAVLTEEILKSVGTLAAALAREATEDDVVPGLAAMRPSGAFITNLNQKDSKPDACRYYAITSQFEASSVLQSLGSPELGKLFVKNLAGVGMRQLMREANDLVVNTRAMTTIGTSPAGTLTETLAYGANPTVYHTNYFFQPATVDALSRWLLDSPSTLHAAGDTNFITISAHLAAAEAKEKIQERAVNYVVLKRKEDWGELYYAFRPGEILQKLEDLPTQSVVEALELRETDQSGQNRPPQQIFFQDVKPSADRSIIFTGDVPAEVLDLETLPFSIDDLVSQTRLIESERPIMRGDSAGFEIPGYAMFHGAPAPDPLRRDELISPGSVRVNMGKKRKGAGVPVALKPSVPAAWNADVAAGAKKAESSKGADDGGDQPPRQVQCHFLAEMDDEVLLDQSSALEVTLSREKIEASLKASGHDAKLVDVGKTLTVQIVPHRNLEVIGDSRATVPVPDPDNPTALSFGLKGLDLGDGEVWVRILQGPPVLATLKLKCKIVKKRSVRAGRQTTPKTDIPPSPSGKPPTTALFVDICETNGTIRYSFNLTSTELGFGCEGYSNKIQGNREAYVNCIYQAIESRRLEFQNDVTAFQRELKDIGGTLWDQLFPKDVREALWNHRDIIKGIMVRSDEPFIPWELVHMKGPDGAISEKTIFFGELGLIRWQDNFEEEPPDKLWAREGRCHYVIPNYPEGDELSHAEEEATFLQDNLKATAVTPRVESVREMLTCPDKFDLLHFACHGEAQTGDISVAALLLEGEPAEPNVYDRLQMLAIGNMPVFIGPDGTRPIVTLNACQVGVQGVQLTTVGGFAQAFLRKKAGMFVGPMWVVRDQTAQIFTEALYTALLEDKTLAEAAMAARAAAKDENEDSWLAYSIYGNPHARLKVAPAGASAPTH